MAQIHGVRWFISNIYGFFLLTGISLCISMLVGNFPVVSLNLTVFGNHFGAVFGFDSFSAFFLLILLLSVSLISFFQKEILLSHCPKFLIVNAILILLTSNLYGLLLLLIVFVLILSFYAQIKSFYPAIIASLVLIILILSNYNQESIDFARLDFAKVRLNHTINYLSILYTIIVFPFMGLFSFNKWEAVPAQNEKTSFSLTLVILLTSVLAIYLLARIWLDLYVFNCTWLLVYLLQLIVLFMSIWTGWQCLNAQKSSHILGHLVSLSNGLLVQIIFLLNLTNRGDADQNTLTVSKQFSMICFVMYLGFTLLSCIQFENIKSTYPIKYYKFFTFFGVYFILCSCPAFMGYVLFDINSQLDVSSSHLMQFIHVLFFITTMSLVSVAVALSFIGWARFLITQRFIIKKLNQRGILQHYTHERLIGFAGIILFLSCFLFQTFPFPSLLRSSFISKAKNLHSLQNTVNFGPFFIIVIGLISMGLLQKIMFAGKLKKVSFLFSNEEHIAQAEDEQFINNLAFEKWGNILQNRLNFFGFSSAVEEKFYYFKVKLYTVTQESLKCVLETTHQYKYPIFLFMTGTGLVFIGWVCR
ncbi:hypothetical protein COMNV_00207 [Commensalibacter sp. Nvir]|uniref:hypothetical protein n=1 Tax=Commensalibacter sp. Nvir TaxID=3069817 RepID=UPI002D3EAA31|nr:hypothetical protein COMNV_00207 [Commensalibacter sp. Nvir]